MSRANVLQISLSDAEMQKIRERAEKQDLSVSAFGRLRILGLNRLLTCATYVWDVTEVGVLLRAPESVLKYRFLLEEQERPDVDARSEFDVLNPDHTPALAEWEAASCPGRQGFFVVAGSPCPFLLLRARIRELPEGGRVPSVLLKPDWDFLRRAG